MMRYIVYTNKKKYQGASSTSYRTGLKLQKAGFDVVINDLDTQEIIIPKKNDVIISFGPIMDEVFKALGSPQDVEVITMTDNIFWDLSTYPKDKTTMIIPQSEVKRLPEGINYVVADLSASPSKEEIKQNLIEFVKNNLRAVSSMKDVKQSVFLGGRLQTKDGWVLNTKESFINVAKFIMPLANGEDVVFVMHGLRGVTTIENGEIKTDLAPAKALYDYVQSQLSCNQKAFFITKEEDENQNRASVFKIITKNNIQTIPLYESGPSGYYYVLNDAVEKGRMLYFTAEQMNFPSEAITIGTNPLDLHPLGKEIGWQQTSINNAETHNNVRQRYEDGNPPKTQDLATFEYIKNKNK